MSDKSNPFACFADSASAKADDPTCFKISKTNVKGLMSALNKIISTNPEAITFRVKITEASTGWSGISIDFEDKSICIQL